MRQLSLTDSLGVQLQGLAITGGLLYSQLYHELDGCEMSGKGRQMPSRPCELKGRTI